MFSGERLKNLRKGKYSQEELAERLNVHSVTISKWENGLQMPHPKTIAELARILGTTRDYLLEITDNPSPSEESEEQQFQGVISRTLQQSSKKEKSVNSGMLIYETKDGYRFEAPPTEIGIKYLERMRLATMDMPANQMVMA